MKVILSTCAPLALFQALRSSFKILDALGVSNNIGGLTTSWNSGFTDGGAPLIGQNRGADRHDRTLKLFRWLLAVNVSIGVIGSLPVSNTLPWLASVFASSKNQFDPAFRDMIVAIHQKTCKISKTDRLVRFVMSANILRKGNGCGMI